MYEYGSLDFTLRSEENFYEAADLDSFRDQDADIIYAHLVKQMRLIPFGDYLRRYIYMQAGYDEDFEQIDLREFQTVIVEAFRESGTPPSFTPTTAKLSPLAKNWLTQTSVSRSVIFLLGFGLDEIYTYSFMSAKLYDKAGLAENDIRRKSVEISLDGEEILGSEFKNFFFNSLLFFFAISTIIIINI